MNAEQGKMFKVCLPRVEKDAGSDTVTAWPAGCTDDAIAKHDILNEGTAFLRKPSAQEALARNVREVLDDYNCTI
jgi:hypothetical protein